MINKYFYLGINAFELTRSHVTLTPSNSFTKLVKRVVLLVASRTQLFREDVIFNCSFGNCFRQAPRVSPKQISHRADTLLSESNVTSNTGDR